MRIRLPAGTYIGGRNYGGGYLSLDDAISAAAAADTLADVMNVYYAVAVLRDKAQRDVERENRRAKFQITQELRAAVQLRGYLDSVLNAIDELAVEPEIREPVRRKPRQIPAAPVEESLPEWEFGFEYETSDYDDSHNVDVNFRVRREDGRSFSESEARRVMYETAIAYGQVPAGYKIAMMDWRRPQWRNSNWRSSADDRTVRGNFSAILEEMSVIPNAWRLGAPRRDR